MYKSITALLLCLLLTYTLQADSDWEEFFPTGLVNAQGESVDPSSLDGRIVCLYFSAKWCGPCHQFTPKLIDFYEANKAHVEVVFVSKDRDADSFAEYMKRYEMPWLAVPWQPYKSDEDNLLKTLVRKYRAGGIPKLVVLSREGNEVITYDGRLQVGFLPEAYAEILRDRDPVELAERAKARSEKKGKTVSEEMFQRDVERYRTRYQEMALEYDAAYEDSLNPPPLKTKPEWQNLVHHYYEKLRAEEG